MRSAPEAAPGDGARSRSTGDVVDPVLRGVGVHKVVDVQGYRSKR